MERAELAARLGVSLLSTPPRDVVVCESEPERFQSAFADAVAAGGRVFLADPKWSVTERLRFDRLCAETDQSERGEDECSDLGWLCIPTGGSSGGLKLARHDGHTVSAAVDGFCRHFGASQVHVWGVLPLHHVSGLVAWLRTVMTGGRYVCRSWTALEQGRREAIPSDDTFISLVPTQLQRLLLQPEAVEWLRRFRAVFIGGGPVWASLLDDGAAARLPLALSYGMTETAAMVTGLRPEEFAAGDRSSGTTLPHAKVAVDMDGTLMISGDSLCRGYYPAFANEQTSFQTSDCGRLDEHGRLWVSGRRDHLIITGGEKVDPLSVEAVLRATEQFSDVAVLGQPDTEWGQAVVACYPRAEREPDWKHVKRIVERELTAYRRPKRYVAIDPWPRNAQGKLNRETLQMYLAKVT